jgi:ADP-heptose:LPS heptosyltransferase
MKILCLQLARLGDIYQTWPTLNGLRRLHPDAEIHLLVREKFASAAEGLAAIDRLWQMPTQQILEPLVKDHPTIEASIRRMDAWLAGLRAMGFDRIINLSFSPASSYLVDLVANPSAVVTGYSRQTDGFLAIPDDASAYFYAQVGTERSNRIHLTDLFALVAGIDLEPIDFQIAESHLPKTDLALPEQYIVVQIGASQDLKTCTDKDWSDIISTILQSYAGQIVFVGNQSESARIDSMGLPKERILNYVGKTKPADLFPILKNAQLLIGCDSMAQHIASMTNTPTLNISFASVRFWETGPRAPRSCVLWFESRANVDVQRIAAAGIRMLSNQAIDAPCILRTDAPGVLYDLVGYQDDDFSWELTRALYMNHPFPMTEVGSVRLAFLRLAELATLGLEQVEKVKVQKTQTIAVNILNQVDAMIEQVGRLEPQVGPVVRWFQTEKLRIGPEDFKIVVEKTRLAFDRLLQIAKLYEMNKRLNEQYNRQELTWKS